AEVDPLAVGDDLELLASREEAPPRDVGVRVALADDEETCAAVRGELDLQPRVGRDGPSRLLAPLERQVVQAAGFVRRRPAVDVALVGRERGMRQVLADDLLGVPAVPDEVGEAGQEDARKDERAEQEALEHVRGEVYVRAGQRGGGTRHREAPSPDGRAWCLT